ncbi:MAG: hypothetical protein GWO11_08930, partial [Desulfuromonadales bacterium]|nr:hypothetical protein [Desulfuromonadales bacterium]NIR34411.1 hypothetical protein [Desulfuromonadales bacterium]NIS44419.1 hypothetical protein [Desulfuromonadales bacterium]
MTTDALTLFARQLAKWARQIIDNGRSPFRKVELSPTVHTALGKVRPSLVFWINRQSLMAGGVLMLPASRAEEDAEQGAACARALGLRHFVSWAPAEIVFWQTEDGEAPKRCKSIQLDGVEEIDIDRFRDELSLVMDELKLLSVTGNIAPRELCEHYLANLCLGYLDDCRDKLAETFRIARGEERFGAPAMEPEEWARHRGALSLFQLLGLSYNDLLPENAQPERLEQAMRLHLPELPPGLAPPAGSDEDLPLPEEVAVALHHLFRRLGQIGWRHDSKRALATVRLLLRQLAPELGLHALTESAQDFSSEGRSLLVNTFEATLVSAESHLVASPAAQAGIALERAILDLPPFAGTAQSPLDVGLPAGDVTVLLGGLDG